MGVRGRLDHQPPRLRPQQQLRVPSDGPVPADPHRARSRRHHARRSRRVELGGRGPSSRRSAVAFDRPSRAWPWFAAFIATTLLVVVLSEVVRPEGADLPEGFVRTLDVLNIIAVSFVVTMLLVVFARGRETAQARVEALLTNVLPEEIAERLQADSHAIADDFDNASILFADVVDFTPLASRLEARDVVGLLDRLFTAFDELVDRYDVEKIKTIGDCYMVAAGVPRPRPDHAQALGDLAVEMLDCAHMPSGQRAPASDRD